MNNLFPACEILKHLTDLELEELKNRLAAEPLQAVLEEQQRRKTGAWTQWACKFEGMCDACGRARLIDEVTAGVDRGWRIGWICYECSLRRQELEKQNESVPEMVRTIKG